MRRKIIVFSVLVIMLTGCAPWVAVGGRYIDQSYQFQTELPGGWMRARSAQPLLITRDGVLLQLIQVERIGVGQDLKHTKKKFSKDMLVQDIVEVITDNHRSDPSRLNFELLESQPAKVAGHPGFKIVFAFRNAAGLKLKAAQYGFMAREWVYILTYQGAARHYFERDLNTFEKVRESFQLVQ